ncbi:MAG: hypothetical protein D6714_18570 [Bacteroidetes bacterium]|nr:MAG: hypothetical protein D6714_18570 [Bacteroidota bacterium]
MVVKFVHILLSWCVLFSTTGVVFVQHYCHDELKKTGVFVDPVECSEAMAGLDLCCQTRLPKTACSTEDTCCKTKTAYFKNNLEFDATLSGQNLWIALSPAVCSSFFRGIAAVTLQKIRPVFSFRAPTPVKRIVLFQCFLC